MKRVAILLSLGVFLSVSCVERVERENKSQVSNVSFTPCQQSGLRSDDLSSKVDVEFTDKGIQITYYNFAVTCDFDTVNVTHTFVNGVLNITQQGSPNQANCICHTDVSYTIGGISQNEVNVIFINGEQVYCHNNQSNCDPNIIIDAEEYFKVPEFRDVLSNMRIEGNNLKFTIAASGCSGNSWVAKLITTGAIEKSLPPQRALQLSFENREMCAAVFSKEFSFNIECLQVPNCSSVYLNIEGKYEILYKY